MWIKLLKSWQSKPVGEKIDTTPEQADVLIKAGYAEKVDDDPLQATITSAIGTATERISQGMGSAIDAALKQFANAAGMSRRGGQPLIFGPGGNGDPGQTFGKFLLAVRNHDVKALDKFGSHWIDAEGQTKAVDLEGGEGALGGFLIPDQFINSLLSLMAEKAIVRPRATVVPMAGRTVRWPALRHSAAPSAGDSAFFAGVSMTWTAEGGEKTQTEPVFRGVELHAHELAGYTVASNSLVEDSGIGLEAMLRGLFAEAMAWAEDYHFLQGTGAGQPLGIINADALLTTSARAGTTTFTLADAALMFRHFLPGANLAASAWVIHPYHMANLITQVSSSTGGQLVWMPDGVRGTPQLVYLGLPVIPSEKVPAVNTAGDVLLCDFSKYLVGEKRGPGGSEQISIAFSEHVKFLTNQGTWRFSRRFDGRPWLDNVVTLADTSSTVSPFVALGENGGG